MCGAEEQAGGGSKKKKKVTGAIGKGNGATKQRATLAVNNKGTHSPKHTIIAIIIIITISINKTLHSFSIAIFIYSLHGCEMFIKSNITYSTFHNLQYIKKNINKRKQKEKIA